MAKERSIINSDSKCKVLLETLMDKLRKYFFGGQTEPDKSLAWN